MSLLRDLPGGPVVKTGPMQGVKVQSLVREIRSHMPCGTAKKKFLFFCKAQLEAGRVQIR